MSLDLTIPMVPVSVNHYKKPRRGGRGFYVTPEAKRFKETVAAIASGRQVEGKQFALKMIVYLGARQRGDGDNFIKITQDALADCGVFNGKSDAHVKSVTCNVFRDRDNPRCVISVEAI